MTLPSIPSYELPDIPAPGRVQWELNPDRTTVLIHDMQSYFVSAYGRENAMIEQCIANITAVRDAAATHGIPVVFTAQPGDQHPARRGLLRDFWGAGLSVGPEAEIIDALRPRDGDIVITKWRYSAFARTDLQEILHRTGRDQLAITGVYAHLGCQVTAVDAYMNDVQPFLIGDAVADFSAAHHAGALRYVVEGCGRVLSTATALAQLAGTTSGRPVSGSVMSRHGMR